MLSTSDWESKPISFGYAEALFNAAGTTRATVSSWLWARRLNAGAGTTTARKQITATLISTLQLRWLSVIKRVVAPVADQDANAWTASPRNPKPQVRATKYQYPDPRANPRMTKPKADLVARFSTGSGKTAATRPRSAMNGTGSRRRSQRLSVCPPSQSPRAYATERISALTTNAATTASTSRKRRRRIKRISELKKGHIRQRASRGDPGFRTSPTACLGNPRFPAAASRQGQ